MTGASRGTARQRGTGQLTRAITHPLRIPLAASGQPPSRGGVSSEQHQPDGDEQHDQHEEELVLDIVRVPHELASEFDELHVEVVDGPDAFGLQRSWSCASFSDRFTFCTRSLDNGKAGDVSTLEACGSASSWPHRFQVSGWRGSIPSSSARAETLHSRGLIALPRASVHVSQRGRRSGPLAPAPPARA